MHIKKGMATNFCQPFLLFFVVYVKNEKLRLTEIVTMPFYRDINEVLFIIKIK